MNKRFLEQKLAEMGAENLRALAGGYTCMVSPKDAGKIFEWCRDQRDVDVVDMSYIEPLNAMAFGIKCQDKRFEELQSIRRVEKALEAWNGDEDGRKAGQVVLNQLRQDYYWEYEIDPDSDPYPNEQKGA